VLVRAGGVAAMQDPAAALQVWPLRRVRCRYRPFCAGVSLLIGMAGVHARSRGADRGAQASWVR
jgi:hypothetical protein